MTNAEAIKVLSESIHDGSKVPWDKIVEAVHLSIAALSQPSLPSNLEEAAKKYRDFREECGIKDPVMLNEIEEAHYAGTGWMAGQFQKIEGELVDWYEINGVDYCCGIRTNEAFEVPEGFYIRKK